MDDASHVRRAAREAVRDVDPDAFRDAIEAAVESGSMAPGVLVVLSARAADEPVGFETVATRAAGTQLIYEGLRLTRDLATDAPWEDEDRTPDANLDVLVADVLVARGFHLLARTEAAERAVETVRAFGRDQTPSPTDDTGGLEADVFDLAVVAGTTAVGTHPSTACREFVADLARSFEGDLPPADVAFDAPARESLAAYVNTRAHPPGVRSATDS